MVAVALLEDDEREPRNNMKGMSSVSSEIYLWPTEVVANHPVIGHRIADAVHDEELGGFLLVLRIFN